MLEQYKNRSISMKLLWLYFSLQGRISRKQYWMFFLLPTVIGVIVALIVDRDSHLASETKSLIEGLIILVFAWPEIVGTVKRYHDINKSGWWFFINLIPIIGSLWCFIETAVFRGTEGNNRFGPSPLRMYEEIISKSNTVRQQPLSNVIKDKGRDLRWAWPTVWADERGGWWKLLITLALVAGGAVVGTFSIFMLLYVLKVFQHVKGQIFNLLLLGLVCGFGLVGLLLGIRQVHNKPIACIFTDGRPFNFWLALQSVALWIFMIFLYSLFWTSNGVEPLIRKTVEFPPALWPLRLIALALLQTSTAVLFWGYLLPRVAAWVKHAWLAVSVLAFLGTVTAMIFSGNSAVISSDALFSGIIFGVACIRAGTLAPIISANIVNGSLMILLYQTTKVTWSYVVFDALAMAIWFVWLLRATRKRP